MEIVDPRSHHGFCLRGAGRKNYVISAKDDKKGLRIVWRLAKDHDSELISCDQRCDQITRYIGNLIAPYISEAYLIRPRIVQMHVEDLKQISKIPSLPHNLRVNYFHELSDSSKYPTKLSLLTESSYRTRTYPFINILEMADATRIPKRLLNTCGPTITFELKPKQGFYQKHPGVNVPFCNNCILQLEKSASGAFEKMYNFCPLELFSGDLSRMYVAMESLIADPHRNLRVFLDGDPIHDDESVLNRRELESLLFPNSPIQLNLLIKALCCVLVGVRDDLEPFHLHDDSILAMLLKAQKIDTIGIVRAFKIYNELPIPVKNQLMNIKNLTQRTKTDFLNASDPRSLLERYFLAATMKDCSLMISFRLLNGVPQLMSDDPSSVHVVRVRPRPDAPHISFMFSIRVVDLDPKSPKNLINAYFRFASGVQTILDQPDLHKTCRIEP